MTALNEVFGYRIDMMNEIGRGGFGTVYKGHGEDGQTVAIKKVSKIRGKYQAATEATKFHYFQKNIKNIHIVEVFSVKSLNDSMWMIMEYCDLGDLNQYFSNYHARVESLKEKLDIIIQIASGIEHLHQMDIAHRDIKPANILLKTGPDCSAIVKLADFGLSKILDPDDMTSAMSSNVGTLMFKAPEFWSYKFGKRVHYHRNVDMYAAALTFAAILQYRPENPLVPKAEGSLDVTENKEPIGFIALSRYMNKQPSLNVIEDAPYDNVETRQTKSLVRDMGNFHPNRRPTSSTVKMKLLRILQGNSNLDNACGQSAEHPETMTAEPSAATTLDVLRCDAIQRQTAAGCKKCTIMSSVFGKVFYVCLCYIYMYVIRPVLKSYDFHKGVGKHWLG